MGQFEKMEEYAKQFNVPIMMKDGIEHLVNYVKNHDIQAILEVGTAIGYSAICMASLRDTITIDTLEIDEERYNEAIKNIDEAQLSNRIHVHLMDAMLFETDKKYDLIFIDAAKAQYGKYMDHFRNNLSVNGVYYFDNLNFHGLVDEPELAKSRGTKALVRKIKAFRDSILNDENLNCEYHPEIGDGIAIVSFKNSQNVVEYKKQR